MNKNYFKWLIKSRKVSILFFTLICIAFQLISFTGYDPEQPLETFLLSANIGGGLSVFMSAAIPILFFSYIHRKSSADMFLALPVSRKEQLITTVVLTWLMAYGSFFLGTLIVWAARLNCVVSIKNLAFIQIFSAYSFLVLILLFSALYMLANSVFDGIVMIGAYSVLPAVVMVTVITFIYSMIAGNFVPSDSFIYRIGTLLSPVALFFTNLEYLLDPKGCAPETFNSSYVVLQLVYGLLSVAILKFHFINRKAERTDQISDEVLSYPFIINAYLILILLSLAWSVVSDTENGLEFAYLLLFFIYIVASFVYKRTLKITWKPVAFFLFACAATIAFAKAGWTTEGFGLSRLPHELFPERYLHYNYSGDVTLDDLGKQVPDYNQDRAYLTLDLCIPSEKASEYESLIERFETLRSEAISNFYNYSASSPGTEVGLSIFNQAKDNSPNLNYYNYNRVPTLSEEELKTLSKYCEITVYPILYTLNDDGSVNAEKQREDNALHDMTLDEFLSWRETRFSPKIS